MTVPCQVCGHPMPAADLDAGNPCWRCRSRLSESKLLEAANRLATEKKDHERTAADRDFWKRLAELLMDRLGSTST